MTPEQKERIRSLFLAACEKEPEERADFLRRACGDDDVVYQEVRSLLESDDETDTFLDNPILGDTFAAANPESLLAGRAGASSSGDAAEVGAESRPPDAAHGRIGPYEILSVLGEGGMGVVYLAKQTEPLRRQVALKLIKLGMDTKQVIARFESERQALAVLTHPNVARVLDAGSTEQGRPYFVMEHVPGIRITEYCDRHNLDIGERLDLFCQVCHAVEHAHQKGIIHRDIKPSNVLVAIQEGKPVPKVIDFGVAKATQGPLTERTLFTEQGQLIGTPEYMSPEQAEMATLDIDTRTDVYALGVLLYELLAGALPFEPTSLRRAALGEIQRLIREQDPPKPSTRLSQLGDESGTVAKRRCTDATSLRRRLRGDLDWITMKAMERDRTRRYATASALADDIARHLRHEPVIASPPSAAYRVKKFVRRNRGLVAAATVVLAVLATGLAGTTVQYLKAERARAAETAERIRAEENERRALASEENERKARALADQRYEEIIRLSDLKHLADACAGADSLWPAHPEKIEAMETWLTTKAAPLRDNLPKHEATLASLRSQALEYDPGQQEHDRETHPKAAELTEQEQRLTRLQEELRDARAEGSGKTQEEAKRIEELQQAVAETEESIRELEDAVRERRTWRFADDQIQWQHNALAGLVQDLRAFVDSDPKKGTLTSVAERLEFARTIEERSVTGTHAAARWAEAIADIAQLEIYGGLRLTPQLGLLPLRRDRRSGLWEFWHIQTGTRPEPEADHEAANPWILNENTGVVFVLVPGGTFWMGAQKEDAKGQNYDPQADTYESPVKYFTLAPFFMSKYEMTQGQWLRFTGENPSKYGPEWSWKGEPPAAVPLHHNTPWNPVEQVTWTSCHTVLDRLALLLPTEAQWEYAARAGTDSVWWTGNEKESIGVERAANLADGWTKSRGGPGAWHYEDWLEDGWAGHSPVGSFCANGFGLHDVMGNVWEWCRDWYGGYDAAVEPGDGLRKPTRSTTHPVRGGGFGSPAVHARSAHRFGYPPEYRTVNVGVRPARSITE